MRTWQVVFGLGTMGLIGLLVETGVLAAEDAQVSSSKVRSLEFGGLQRSYRMHVPENLPKGKRVPLVLAFHGGGSESGGMEKISQFNPLADREKFIVVYPEGVDKHWNDGREASNIRSQQKEVDDLGFIGALLDSLDKEYPIDHKRIFATGISNGGIFSHYVAAGLAHRVAAIAPVVGGLAEPLKKDFDPESPVSVFIIQGTEDPLVPFKGGPIRPGQRGRIIPTSEAVALWVKRNGCEERAKTIQLPDTDPQDGCRVKGYRYEQGQAGTEVLYYEIEGGGHTWPGGTQYLPPRLIGRLCKDFDATEEIWNFFKAHPKP